MQWMSAIPDRHGSRSGAAFDEVPDSVYTHTEIQATHDNTHEISIGIGYPGRYARKETGRAVPSILPARAPTPSCSNDHRQEHSFRIRHLRPDRTYCPVQRVRDASDVGARLGEARRAGGRLWLHREGASALTGEAVGAVERVGELVAALLAGEAD